MSVQESIHAALTVSETINNHIDSLRNSANNLSKQSEQVAKIASGSQSGDAAVRLLGSASDALRKTIAVLDETSSCLEAYADKVRRS